ncbi:MAG: Gfo/Idh/MocA family oxidoreductase [Melioribacter sp.]|uniref:Gfo/Idh/MocA family protein n=1 Tax=Rosettibacter primus TaxID=3111523 RepID=UPI00247C8F9A|nr:Gfo/Idh/MocA family oxidoreductase [Melioribacter sp.]
MKKIKLGIIGCGIAAKELHLPALKKLYDKFEITAVCNHTEKKAVEFSKLVGNVPYYLDYKDLLKDKNVEAVDITLPIELNYKTAVDSINANKHVFLEKPLAANLIEAKRLVDVSKKKSVVCFLAENYRCDKLYLEIKKLLERKIIGNVYSVIWNVFNNLSLKNKYAQTKWRQQNKYPGGFVYDGGIHNIAALRLLFGSVKYGYAIKKSIRKQIGTDDTFSFNYEFESGVIGVLNIYFSVNGIYKNELLIFGDNGTIITTNNEIEIYGENKKAKKIIVETDGGFENEFNEFYNAVVKGKKFINTFEEGYNDVKTLLNAFKSAEKNKIIDFRKIK